jgi:hypothetical protein
MFIPDDHRLRTFANAIKEQRRHSLRKVTEEERPGPAEDAPPAGAREDALEGQLSLFSVISAVPLDEHGRPLQADRIYQDESAAEENALPEWVGQAGANDVTPPPAPSPGWLAPPPAPPDPAPPLAEAVRTRSPLARRRELREANSEVVRELVHGTGKSHAELNAELNRKAGIRRVSEATLKQLEQRLEIARRLLKR